MRKIIWAGDSTAAFNGADTFPQTGIGQEFDRYCKRDILVLDFAVNGKSSKSFYEEGLLQPAEALLEPNDFLFIQFGHNDEKPKADRHTDPYTTYQEYLMRYICAAKSHGAVPVLITPLSRRLFKADGTIENSHGEYPAAVKDLGIREGIAVVDLTERSRVLYEQTGELQSRKWFMYFPAGIYENYKDEVKDNTHLSCDGAVRMAGLIAKELKELGGIYAEILK